MIATIDITPRETQFEYNEVEPPHYIRRSEPLSILIQEQITQEKPIVLLAHANDYHAFDAIELQTNNFPVLLEKPYALDETELIDISRHFDDYKKGALLEYYLMMKAAPLLYGFGKIPQNSFYTNENDIFIARQGLSNFGKQISSIHGILHDLIGDPQEVLVDILEGEGAASTYEGRGAFFVDKRRGGGVMSDLGIHALAPLFAIEDFIGTISYIPDSVRIAQATPYLRMADSMGISREYVSESYADFSLITSRGVSIRCRIGKYVLGRNERSIVMKGSRGHVLLDMNECVLFVNGEPILQTPKNATKYYPVLRAGLGLVIGDTPYLFHPNKVALSSQNTVLKIRRRAYEAATFTTYEVNALPHFP